jgi:hypothetical protein
MSVTPSAPAVSAAMPRIGFHAHGQKKGVQGAAATNSISASTASTSGSNSTPTSTQGLFSNLLQTLEGVIGIPAITSLGIRSTSTAAAAPTAASSTTPAAAQTQNVQTFLHSLFQALKDGGLESPAAATPAGAGSAAGASAASGATGTAGQYEGRLASSLQTLIQQLGTTGAASASAANLSASFNSLIQGTSGTAATTSTASTAALQSFLNGLLRNVQGNDGRAFGAVGNNVNATV